VKAGNDLYIASGYLLIFSSREHHADNSTSLNGSLNGTIITPSFPQVNTTTYPLPVSDITELNENSTLNITGYDGNSALNNTEFKEYDAFNMTEYEGNSTTVTYNSTSDMDTETATIQMTTEERRVKGDKVRHLAGGKLSAHY